MIQGKTRLAKIFEQIRNDHLIRRHTEKLIILFLNLITRRLDSINFISEAFRAWRRPRRPTEVTIESAQGHFQNHPDLMQRKGLRLSGPCTAIQ